MFCNKKICSNMYSTSFTEKEKKKKNIKRSNSVETYVDPMYYKFNANKKLVRKNKDLSY